MCQFHDIDLSKFSSLNYEFSIVVNNLKSVGVDWNLPENDLNGLFCGHAAICLAIVQNLVSTLSKMIIQLTKTKPICDRCHQEIKQLTLIKQRDFILRDNIRVYHFHTGHCSCHDFD